MSEKSSSARPATARSVGVCRETMRVKIAFDLDGGETVRLTLDDASVRFYVGALPEWLERAQAMRANSHSAISDDKPHCDVSKGRLEGFVP
jgi:hypothetical protein